MPTRRPTAVVKRDQAPAPQVKTLNQPKGANYPVGRMLIASPIVVADEVRSVPSGRVITLSALRERLARRFDADYTCPLTTGIFLRVAAEAALEEGLSDVLPVWRVVREDGACLEKIAGGPGRQAERLRAEGVDVVQRRTRFVVADLSRVKLPD
jgi:hypothetical protein